MSNLDTRWPALACNVGFDGDAEGDDDEGDDEGEGDGDGDRATMVMVMEMRGTMVTGAGDEREANWSGSSCTMDLLCNEHHCH